jgi:hypothetical protein
MNILTNWLRHYLPTLPVTDRQLADDLTLRGIAVEGVHPLGPSVNGKPGGHLFEMDITTNRVDAMNHYGIAREAATIYNLPLAPLINDASSRPEPKAEWRDPRICLCRCSCCCLFSQPSSHRKKHVIPTAAEGAAEGLPHSSLPLNVAKNNPDSATSLGGASTLLTYPHA